MTATVRGPAINLSFDAVLASAGFLVSRIYQYGPRGVGASFNTGDGLRGSILVSQSGQPDDPTEWIHTSIAFADRDPTYADLVTLHRAVFGRKRFAYQVFAPASSHVNIHAHALHLWGRADGAAVLPDFGRLGTI